MKTWLVILSCLLLYSNSFGEEISVNLLPKYPMIIKDEGDFWIDSNKKLCWKIISKNYSHIVYQGNHHYWTRCHSCFKFIPLENSHKVDIDRKTLIIIDSSGRWLGYEELYYCDKCWKWQQGNKD